MGQNYGNHSGRKTAQEERGQQSRVGSLDEKVAPAALRAALLGWAWSVPASPMGLRDGQCGA